MKKNRLRFISILLLLFTFLSAHEFWLHPAEFIYKKGETAVIKFQVGENFTGENWKGERSKINFLYQYENGVKKDIASLLSGNPGDSLEIPLAEDGTSTIVYNGLNSFLELDAAKFNAYLEEDGLREVLEYRNLHHENDSMGRERYQRSVKTILQVGEKYDSSYKLSTALPLDIIPIQHPFLVRDRQKMVVKVLFEKKPLADQLISVWYRENNKTSKEELLTDQAGIASFKVKRSGRWMVSTVKMIRVEGDPKADWQSYWGSFTWGYE